MSDETRCPFTCPVPEDTLTSPVPEHLRTVLAKLWEQRAGLRVYPLPDPRYPNTLGGWYRASTPICEAFKTLEDELRKLAGAGKRTCLEYFENWQFRCLDQQTLRAEYVRRGGKITENPEEKVRQPVPGRTWKEDEVAHLCFGRIVGRKSCPHVPSATLEDVLLTTRAKKKRSVA